MDLGWSRHDKLFGSDANWRFSVFDRPGTTGTSDKRNRGVDVSLSVNLGSDGRQISGSLGSRTARAVVFTVAPRTPFLMTFFTVGKLFPRSDRSPVMIPQDWRKLAAHTGGTLDRIERVTRGFYISECLEYRP